MQICEYGCETEAKFQLNNGKWCCSETYKSCPGVRKKKRNSMIGKNTGPKSEETKKKISEAHMGKQASEKTKKKISEAHMGKQASEETKKKISKVQKGIPKTKEHKKKMSEAKKGKIPWNKNISCSEETKKKISESKKLTIDQIKEKYPLFSKIEEMRYNPDKPNEKEIQVRCKNHDCKNSKEKDGWFTPTAGQLVQRKWTIETPRGFGESNFYCSQYCKDTCIIFNQHTDPLKENNLPYTIPELAELRRQVLKRDENVCQYCGDHGDTVHHIRPIKLEPFLALDTVYAITVCKTCHHKYGHKKGTICSTGNLAAQTCNSESQKFLNQK